MARRLSSNEKLRCFPNILKKIQTLLVIGLVILPTNIYAQSNDDCLMCHSDNELKHPTKTTSKTNSKKDKRGLKE